MRVFGGGGEELPAFDDVTTPAIGSVEHLEMCLAEAVWAIAEASTQKDGPVATRFDRGDDEFVPSAVFEGEVQTCA